MSPDTFRRLLADLLHAAAESGLDVFFIANEMSVASMQLVDNCRADLVECDEGEETPY